MMASIEDSMAELADPGGQLLGGYILDQRRASRVSRRSHRSSVGGKGSNNGSDNEFRNSIQEFNQGLTTTTTTAEVTTCMYLFRQWSLRNFALTNLKQKFREINFFLINHT